MRRQLHKGIVKGDHIVSSPLINQPGHHLPAKGSTKFRRQSNPDVRGPQNCIEFILPFHMAKSTAQHISIIQIVLGLNRIGLHQSVLGNEVLSKTTNYKKILLYPYFKDIIYGCVDIIRYYLQKALKHNHLDLSNQNLKQMH